MNLSLFTDGDARTLAAILVFVATYAVVAIGKLPGTRLDRAGAALLGASLMVACGAIPLEEAYRAIDFDTIALLLGMMIVVANLRLSGFFRVVGAAAVARARHPAALLAAIVLVSGVLSAVLVNDTVCLVMTPLVIEVVRRLRRPPVPYLLAVAMASNVGSVATITGNPQNMIIGSLSKIAYGSFAAALAPVALGGLLLVFALIALLHPREFFTATRLQAEHRPARAHRALAWKAVLVTAAMVVLFFAGVPVAKVALVGGACLLLTRSIKADKVYAEIDWPLLLMFAGLFVVVAGLERAVLTPERVAAVARLHLESIWILSAVTALLSNVVSNVPAVLVLKPFVGTLADPERAWLVVAMAATLAGNLTLVGSVANLIVARRAQQDGIEIGLWAYARVGVPLTLATIALGAWWL
jgi:Na+/H+ antiporter NhaD/arsenite permease-like protein